MPNEEHAVLASTANELRRDRYTHIDPKKLKAAAEGLSQSGFVLIAELFDLVCLPYESFMLQYIVIGLSSFFLLNFSIVVICLA